MTYQFDTDIAALYGVDESIMIANLQFWIRKNEGNCFRFGPPGKSGASSNHWKKKALS